MFAEGQGVVHQKEEVARRLLTGGEGLEERCWEECYAPLHLTVPVNLCPFAVKGSTVQV